MNLKRIEISGFKSFLNRLDVDFSSGITAIIGPNGCGKTNIVDAIRWVLGEQKTRMLRNTKMENVIFNGTKLRKPLGMAEVHMTLSNDDHALPMDYEEVTISRKLYRSGLSEYSINGEVARLKDIRNLLIDTGLGSHTYSIIEREMVDSVISDKDQDKRHLLEEAAGISRYRVQREEALRKIKHTESDLTRLGDILSELDKEIRSLRYQMGKARRFMRLKAQVDRLEGSLIKRSLFELLKESEEVSKEREHYEGITLAGENEITIREDALQELRIKGSEFERRLQDLQETRYGLSQSLQQHEERIAILKERSTSLGVRIGEDEEEIARAERKLTTLAEELVGHHRDVEQKEAELEKRRRDIAVNERELSAVTKESKDLNGRLRDKKRLALELAREEERERGQRTRLAELHERRKQIENERTRLLEEENAIASVLKNHQQSVAVASDRINKTSLSLEKMIGESDKTLDLISECEQGYTSANIELNRLKEKKGYLERIKKEHGRRGVTILDSTRIKGMLADHVRVGKEYRRCFEACLGPVLDAMLARSKEDALGCLDDIKRNGNGGAQLLYPNGHRRHEVREATESTLGSALDFVSAEDGVIEYLAPYLASVLVVGDVDTAVQLLEGNPDTRVATLDGVFFDGPGRILVAGSDEIDVTLLELDSKLDELTDAVIRSETEASELGERKARLLDLKTRLSDENGRLRLRLRTEENQRESLLEEQRRLDVDLARIREKLSSLAESAEEHDRMIGEIERQLVPTESPNVSTDEQLAQLDSRAAALQEKRDALTERTAKVNLELMQLGGEISTAREKIKNIQMLEGELHELVRSRRDDMERCRKDIASGVQETSQTRERIAELHEKVERIEREIDTIKESYDETKERGGVLEKELKELKEQRDQKRANLQRCDLELARVRTRVDGLLEKARENFNQDLSSFVEGTSRFDPREWEELDTDDLGSLRSKLEAVGPVNMLAVEEFNEKKERFDFLTAQKQDLEDARESLIQAIRRINREARRRLNATFVEVRDNFKTTFQTLFDGGEADLLFTDSDDPLEANIRIVASPKGKRLHDISSLSGGERALVALSLLFAIYLVKPSAFCVFDEVDAPLDDANIARFVRMLKSFTDRTQFIVITHNKRTMEAADYLYGVTMQEPGVSRMISVHISEVHKFQEKPVPQTAHVAHTHAHEEVTVET